MNQEASQSTGKRLTVNTSGRTNMRCALPIAKRFAMSRSVGQGSACACRRTAAATCGSATSAMPPP